MNFVRLHWTWESCTHETHPHLQLYRITGSFYAANFCTSHLYGIIESHPQNLLWRSGVSFKFAAYASKYFYFNSDIHDEQGFWDTDSICLGDVYWGYYTGGTYPVCLMMGDGGGGWYVWDNQIRDPDDHHLGM